MSLTGPEMRDGFLVNSLGVHWFGGGEPVGQSRSVNVVGGTVAYDETNKWITLTITGGGGGGDVPATRALSAGAGLIGGGTLEADRVFNIVAGDASIVVNANDIVVGVINDTQHGNRGGGSLHSLVTTAGAGAAGFMSVAMLVKLNGIEDGATNDTAALAAIGVTLDDHEDRIAALESADPPDTFATLSGTVNLENSAVTWTTLTGTAISVDDSTATFYAIDVQCSWPDYEFSAEPNSANAGQYAITLRLVVGSDTDGTPSFALLNAASEWELGGDLSHLALAPVAGGSPGTWTLRARPMLGPADDPATASITCQIRQLGDALPWDDTTPATLALAVEGAAAAGLDNPLATTNQVINESAKFDLHAVTEAEMSTAGVFDIDGATVTIDATGTLTVTSSGSTVELKSNGSNATLNAGNVAYIIGTYVEIQINPGTWLALAHQGSALQRLRWHVLTAVTPVASPATLGSIIVPPNASGVVEAVVNTRIDATNAESYRLTVGWSSNGTTVTIGTPVAAAYLGSLVGTVGTANTDVTVGTSGLSITPSLANAIGQRSVCNAIDWINQ